MEFVQKVRQIELFRSRDDRSTMLPLIWKRVGIVLDPKFTDRVQWFLNRTKTSFAPPKPNCGRSEDGRRSWCVSKNAWIGRGSGSGGRRIDDVRLRVEGPQVQLRFHSGCGIGRGCHDHDRVRRRHDASQRAAEPLLRSPVRAPGRADRGRCGDDPMLGRFLIVIQTATRRSQRPEAAIVPGLR